MNQISPLVMFAHDGPRFHEAVEKRLVMLPGQEIGDILAKARIDPSTAWRWKKGSVPSLATVQKIERAVQFYERQHAAQIKSSTVSPSARL